MLKTAKLVTINFSMLIGEYHHTVDSKGRIAVPTKFRKALLQGVVITRGIDRCLFVYPKKTWDQIADKISGLSMNQKNNRAFARLILAGAMDESPDKQGRITIPDYLRTYAALDKNVVIAGVHDRLEIWNEQEWEKYTRSTEKHSEEIAEEIEFFQSSE